MSQEPDQTVLRAAGLRIAPGQQLLDRYQVLEQVADGASASVLRARDLHTERVVALKLFDPLRSGDPVGRARLLREFEILVQLDHPHIAHSVRLERLDDVDIMVMEFLEGETLASRLRRGPLSPLEVTQVAQHIGSALEACHGAGVLHRDLKPANVMLHPERGAVVLDFGVAWLTGAATLTRTGALIGTPQYMAPEVFESTLLDARSDLYALGAMIYEMLAGRPLRVEDSVAALLASGFDDSAPPLSTLRSDLPASLVQTVESCIARLPARRPASAKEFLRLLRDGQAVDAPVLETHIRCQSCSTPMVIDLPFCPGCGLGFDWELSPGRFAVQLDHVEEPGRVARFLGDRYAAALGTSVERARTRLAHTPVPLITGASEVTAEQLASEMRHLGCRAHVVRARRILGARVRASAATPAEMAGAAILHLAAVALVGLAMLVLGAQLSMVAPLPAVLAVFGVALATAYARRPLLKALPGTARTASDRRSQSVQQSLRSLDGERARHLAASVVVRAAPLFSPGRNAVATTLRDDVIDLLDQALIQVAIVDSQSQLLQSRSRSRLLAQIAEAQAQCDRGDSDAIARLAELEQEKHDLVQTSLAHDVAVAEVLELSTRVSGLMRDASPAP
ncbi:MAG: serine/threonine-protein kinase [Pseudomonadota bacterium]